MLVEDVMETDIVTCEAEKSLRAAVEQMLKNHTGSVIVTLDGNPTGILTGTDVLLAGYKTESPFGEIPLGKAMSQQLITIAPAKSIRTAMRKMREEGIKKLPVRDGIELVGILTLTDINRQYRDIVQEIHQMEQPPTLSEAELRGLNASREEDG
jgi:CBS domain-containing protein